MPNYQRKIVYLSQSQYEELVEEGSIVVNGTTITFSQNDLYATPYNENPIPAPSSPSSGDFLCYNGTAWVATTVPAANGVSF